MITSLKIKKIATYDSFEGITIDSLKKVNFIYGTNGSGKTTISNYINDPENIKFSSCEIQWQNGAKIKTLVYNKTFRERNFGNGKLKGVFTLGEATKEEIEIIEKKNELLKSIKESVEKKKETLKSETQKFEDIEIEFTSNCWKKIYKKFEKEFKEAFTGAMRSKEAFKNRLLDEFSNNKADLLTIEEIQSKAKVIFGEVPIELSVITKPDFTNLLKIEKDPIWQTIIVGKADVEIARLIQKLSMNDWVNQGRDYIQDDEVCPFCQEMTITPEFKTQLESFFDETYMSNIAHLKKQKQEYSSYTSNIFNELTGIEDTQKELKNSKLDLHKFSSYLKTLSGQAIGNAAILINKENEPSRKVALTPLNELLELISELIDEANDQILKYNELVANYRDEKEKLIKAIWKYLAEEFREEIESFLQTKTGIEKGRKAIKGQLDEKRNEFRILKEEIEKLTSNVTSIQPTIDEINRLLKFYGFLNFEIVPGEEEGYYQIKRENGEIAEETLSEGEITFITFLYFLQRVKGGDSEEDINEERILVIDDPISSLDSNVLFVLSTLIKELIKKIKAGDGNVRQLILLTHNVYFHREVSFEGGRPKGERSNFWILRKNLNKSNIQHYGDKNPIQSSYELLWRELREWRNNSGITVQNVMRRVLENFFSILGSKRDDFLISKFSTSEERDICRSLLSWANEGSHTLPDDLYVEAPDELIEKYLSVFKNIFVFSDNTGHYKMMMGEAEDQIGFADLGAIGVAEVKAITPNDARISESQS